MSNDFLSQEEIDSLLNGGSTEKNEENSDVEFDDNEKDLLGEVGNISMGSASTALSQLLNQEVLITTPHVELTTLNKLKKTFEVPAVSVEVKYTDGINGENILVIKSTDAAIFANLMMGGDGTNIEKKESLSEIEISAVLEAMNQMIGSSATSMATMLTKQINISPPNYKLWEESTSPLANGIGDNETIVKVSFKLTVGKLIDSNIMQILPINTAKRIISIMTGNNASDETVKNESSKEIINDNSKQDIPNNEAACDSNTVEHKSIDTLQHDNHTIDKSSEKTNEVNVKKADFKSLEEVHVNSMPKNIDLILDVPLEISVVLGKTQMKIKDILNLSSGSLVELDKLAEEPVEILVNGKIIAYGEVVVVDENFGVRITSIVNSEDRIKSLR